MNPQLLVAHFDRLSEAPNAIPRLRRFIRDLAVRGRLVDQNAKDEPASQLLKRINAKTTQTAIGKGTTKSKAGCLATCDAPFEIPPDWIWVQLGRICSKTGSGSTPRGGKSVYQRESTAATIRCCSGRDGTIEACACRNASRRPINSPNSRISGCSSPTGPSLLKASPGRA